MMGQPRMMGHPGMRLQGQPGGLGAPRAAVPFGQIPGLRGNAPRAMGVPRNMYAQPMGGVRPMMAPAGVRQTFGNVNANSPYKFNQQVRNAPQSYGVNDLTNQFQATNINNANVNVQQQQVVPQQQQQQQQPQQQTTPQELNAAMLAAAEPSQQKQMLGERIYPLVNDQIGSEQAGKVTGMLLEIENFELLKLIDEPALLKDKVTEAMKVLQDHSDK
jgi:polyadenylate-binding protein